MDGDDIRLGRQCFEVHLLDRVVRDVGLIEVGIVDEVVGVEACREVNELAGYLAERREADCLADQRFDGLSDFLVPGPRLDRRSVLGRLSGEAE